MSFSQDGVNAYYYGTVSIADSVFSDNKSTAVTISSQVARPVVRNNVFLRNGLDGGLTSCAEGSATDRNGPVRIYSSEIDLGSLTGNTGSGNGYDTIFLSGTLVAGEQVWPTTGLPIVVGADFGPDVCGLNWGSGSLMVLEGTTLTVPAGVIVKFSPNSELYVEGSLLAQGTETSPVVFTSWRDDTAGGDTNTDGTTTSPAPGDWWGIRVWLQGEAALDGSEIRYAGVALQTYGGHVSVRGRIVYSTIGVSNSSPSTLVDALFVDWGDASGPGPAGSGPMVQGLVMYTPWIGFTLPELPPREPIPQEPVAVDCTDVLVVGVRGSGEDPQGPPPNYGIDPASDSDGFGTRSWDAYFGFQKKLREYRPDVTIREYGIRYRALGVAHDPLENSYLGSIDEGVAQLKNFLEQEITRCKNDPQEIVLIGYSQGALAVHLALLDMEGESVIFPDWSIVRIFDRISSVILIADPAKVGWGSETLFETTNKPAGAGVRNADGIWTQLWPASVVAGGWEGPLPETIANRTVAICHNYDIVCAPPLFTLGAVKVAMGIDAHTSYTAEELNWLGEQAAVFTAARLPSG